MLKRFHRGIYDLWCLREFEAKQFQVRVESPLILTVHRFKAKLMNLLPFDSIYFVSIVALLFHCYIVDMSVVSKISSRTFPNR